MQAILSCRSFISADPMVLEVSLTDFLELFLLHICFRFWTRHWSHLQIFTLIKRNNFFSLSLYSFPLWFIVVAVVQWLSHVQLFVTPWSTAHQASLSFTIFLSLLKLMSVELVKCHPIILSSVIPFSSCHQSFQHQGLFQWVGSLNQVTKVLKLQLQH